MEQRRQRILVIDDEKEILDIYGFFLGRMFDTTLTDNVNDACTEMRRALQQGPRYDAVIVDRKINGDDGDVWVKKMREWGYDRPILMVSSANRPDDAYPLNGEDAPSGQNYFFLDKPPRFRDLDRYLGQMVR